MAYIHLPNVGVEYEVGVKFVYCVVGQMDAEVVHV